MNKHYTVLGLVSFTVVFDISDDFFSLCVVFIVRCIILLFLLVTSELVMFYEMRILGTKHTYNFSGS